MTNLHEDIDGGIASFASSSRKYFDKMVSECKEKGIKLILVKTPSDIFSQEMHNAVKQYADAHDLPFYDFNTDYLCKETGFVYNSSDMNNTGSNPHVNPSGARKLSTYLAKKIVENGWAVGVEDEQWEASKPFNDGLYKDFKLKHTEDLLSYLKMLNDDRYTVMLSVKDEASTALTEEIKEALRNLGLTEEWKDAYRKSYLALIERGKVVYEGLSSKKLEYKDSFRAGVMRLSMVSAGNTVGNQSSIKINEKEQSKNQRGMNIVVYSNDRKCVIDTVNFDTFEEGCTCHR